MQNIREIRHIYLHVESKLSWLKRNIAIPHAIPHAIPYAIPPFTFTGLLARF